MFFDFFINYSNGCDLGATVLAPRIRSIATFDVQRLGLFLIDKSNLIKSDRIYLSKPTPIAAH